MKLITRNTSFIVGYKQVFTTCLSVQQIVLIQLMAYIDWLI